MASKVSMARLSSSVVGGAMGSFKRRRSLAGTTISLRSGNLSWAMVREIIPLGRLFFQLSVDFLGEGGDLLGGVGGGTGFCKKDKDVMAVFAHHDAGVVLEGV